MATKERPVIVGVGEVLWDILPRGPQLGGAPANFAYHAQSLGARSLVITRVGNDPLGHEVLQRFREMNLPVGTVQVDDAMPTGTVTVTLANEGVPEFLIGEHAAWDRLVVTSAALEAVRQADAICFGSLAQRDAISRATIQHLLTAASTDTLRVFDINLRQRFYSREVIEQSLRLANVLKLNEAELSVISRMFTVPGSARDQVEWFADTFAFKLVALTCGSQGSELFSAGRWSKQPPRVVEVVDTVGAGDSFTAALTMGLLGGLELEELHAIAAEVASYVCLQSGATPRLPETFREKLTKLSRGTSTSVTAPGGLRV